MKELCNQWGPGAIFAFSGLDGTCNFTRDLCGTLCGDCLGIRFAIPGSPVLAIDCMRVSNITYQAVTSDYIKADLTIRPSEIVTLTILFTGKHHILGRTSSLALPFLTAYEPIRQATQNDFVELATYKAPKQADQVLFSLGYGSSKEEASNEAAKALEADFDQEEQKKLHFYKDLPVMTTHPELQKLFYKCCSVMKSQIYTKEGMFHDYWSTPDRVPHRKYWLWDSVFHSIGHRHISVKLAQTIYDAIFDTQRSDGFLPHMATPDQVSDITQPPILAWGVLKLCEASTDSTHDLDFLRHCYPKIQSFLTWLEQNRKTDASGLYSWAVSKKDNCKCDECGMDNSPRFDQSARINCIDLSCFMANEYRCMASIAALLGLDHDNALWVSRFEDLKIRINQKMWDQKDHFYYDTDIHTDELIRVKSVASFLPLFAGICDEFQAKQLLAHLEDQAEFNTGFEIPSLAACEPAFGSDMWRGNVWINYNYMIAEGLKKYNFHHAYKELVGQTIQTCKHWYDQEGVIYEFYDCRNRISPSCLTRKSALVKPYNFNVHIQTIRDFGWSCALLADMIANF